LSTLNQAIGHDITANRPAAGIAGRLFFASDTGKIWRDNGTTWDDVTPTGGGGATPNWVTKSPDTPPASPTAYDDEFDAASLNTSLWTWNNQENAVASLSNSRLILTSGTVTNFSNNAILQPLPAAPWAFTCEAVCEYWGQPRHVGMVLYETSSTKFVTLSIDPSGYPAYIYAQYGMGLANNTTDIGYSVQSYPIRGHLRFRYTSPTLYWDFSVTGAGWGNLYSEAVTTHFTTAPDKVGLFTQGALTYQVVSTFDWFRRTA